MATTHRCILRCLTQLGFEALSVATTQSIAWKTGPSFSLRGLPCEWSQNDLEIDSVYVLSFFFNTSPSSGKNLRGRSREKKRVELNHTALLVGDICTDLRVDLAMTGAINARFFFFGSFYKRVARGAFSLTLTCRTILPLSFGGEFQCIHVYPSSWERLEFVQWSSSRRSFAKMSWRTSPKQSRDNRRQQVTVFLAKMRAVIRFNSRRNWFIARPWRGETTALLLFFVVHLSDLRVRSHHFTVSVKPFFFGAKSYQEKGISRGLIDRSTHAWGFDASNPSWVKHRRMRRCVVATPLFFIPLPPNRSDKKKKTERKNVRSGSVCLLWRQSNVAKFSSSCVSWHGVILSFCSRSCDNTRGKHLLHSSPPVAPRMHVGVLRFVFRTRSKRSERTEERVLLRASRSARLLFRKNRTCANFFFSFFGDQVASRWSPTRKVSRQWRVGDR